MAISLNDRLRQVVAGSVPRVNTGIGGEPERLEETAPVDARPVPRAVPMDGYRVADVLAGEWVQSSVGAVVVVDRFYTADRRHGRVRIGDIVEPLQDGAPALQALARAWPGREPRSYTSDLCFFDLETTGLAGGAGTQAFLFGCARIEDDGLRVRQFLLPGFEHERALLTNAASWILDGATSSGGARETPTLVSFNGRSFDLPLIETRYLFHRLPFPFDECPHLDLLHPARRIWKERPVVAGPALDDDSCRLSVLERHLAGYHRVGDVPGFEIPSRYFRFVRSGDAAPLEAVLEHNRIDLLSLALVTSRTVSLIAQGPHATAHPREALGLGRLYERASMLDEAEATYAHAAAVAARAGRESDAGAEALRRLALCRRRAGRMVEAADAWHALIELPGCPARLRHEAREALAIHHEHRSRNLQAARTLVLDVLNDSIAPRVRAGAEYRLQRLERKLDRAHTVMHQALLIEG
jgi:uncharacterized protein